MYPNENRHLASILNVVKDLLGRQHIEEKAVLLPRLQKRSQVGERNVWNYARIQIPVKLTARPDLPCRRSLRTCYIVRVGLDGSPVLLRGHGFSPAEVADRGGCVADVREGVVAFGELQRTCQPGSCGPLVGELQRGHWRVIHFLPRRPGRFRILGQRQVGGMAGERPQDCRMPQGRSGRVAIA